MDTKTKKKIVNKGEYMKAQMKRMVLLMAACTVAICAVLWGAVTSCYFWIEVYNLAFGGTDHIYLVLLLVFKTAVAVGGLFVFYAVGTRLVKQVRALEPLVSLTRP